MSDIAQRTAQWHVDAGGSKGRLAGHALRLLNEAVELCIAAGAGADEIKDRVKAELWKAFERAEIHKPVDEAKVRAELADVQVCTDVLANYTGNVDLTKEREHKLVILKERQWEADSDGALWRPGMVAK